MPGWRWKRSRSSSDTILIEINWVSAARVQTPGPRPVTGCGGDTPIRGPGGAPLAGDLGEVRHLETGKWGEGEVSGWMHHESGEPFQEATHLYASGRRSCERGSGDSGKFRLFSCHPILIASQRTERRLFSWQLLYGHCTESKTVWNTCPCSVRLWQLGPIAFWGPFPSSPACCCYSARKIQ